MTQTIEHYLPEGLPHPAIDPEGLSEPFWTGLRGEKLLAQCCDGCGTWQFGPEWICHACRKFDPPWRETWAAGRIYSWERIWHPSHPALEKHGPYLVVLVELLHAGGIRMLGNLLGDPLQEVAIGTDVEGVFEHHAHGPAPYTLLQWRVAGSG